MSSRKGYRGGFNPFRRSGKFATANGADRSSDAGAAAWADKLGVANEHIGSTGKSDMNAAIRQAAGRGGEDDGEGRRMNLEGYDSQVSPRLLAEVDAMPQRTIADMPRAARALLADDIPAEESLHYGMYELATQAATAETAERDRIYEAMDRAFYSARFRAPKGVIRHDLIDMMDKVEDAPDPEIQSNRQLYGAALALKANEPDVALMFLDGPDGGIGWSLTRQELEQSAGPAPTTSAVTRRAAEVGVDFSKPLTERDRRASITAGQQMGPVEGPYKGKTIAQIYKEDPDYLRAHAYDHDGIGPHIGNYLHALGELR